MQWWLRATIGMSNSGAAFYNRPIQRPTARTVTTRQRLRRFLEQLFLKASLPPLDSGLPRAEFSCVDETSFLERRQMLFGGHEVGGSITGGRGGIDVIANQNGSSGNQQAVELSIKPP
jgi:hypothetical protein